MAAKQKEITAKQKELYDLIVKHFKELGFSPTCGRLAKQLGKTRGAVKCRLEQLHDKGYIKLLKENGRTKITLPGDSFTVINSRESQTSEEEFRRGLREYVTNSEAQVRRVVDGDGRQAHGLELFCEVAVATAEDGVAGRLTPQQFKDVARGAVSMLQAATGGDVTATLLALQRLMVGFPGSEDALSLGESV